jgi:hypothetical protein
MIMEIDWSLSPAFLWYAVILGIALAVLLVSIEIGDLIDQWRAHRPRQQ